MSTEKARRTYYLTGKADGVASHESILRGEYLGLVIVEPDQRAESMRETADLQVASSNPDITIYWLVGRNGE